MDELVKNQVRHIFESANFVRDLGMQLVRIEDEFCETILVPAERHRQQHGLIMRGRWPPWRTTLPAAQPAARSDSIVTWSAWS